MVAYVVRRFTQSIFVIILVTVLIFLVMRLLPGDPILLFVSEAGVEYYSEEDLNKLRAEFGLDKTLVVQYFDWIGGIFHGNLGTSVTYKQPVSLLLSQSLPVTIHLGILAFIFSSILGILFGLVAALRRGKSLDNLVTPLAIWGISVPNFWLGILMILFFGLFLRWLPIQGYTSPFEDFWLSTRQLIMPVICLSVMSIASTTRQTRSSMLEVIRQDYIRTAWSKGLSERLVVIRHVLKNGLIPVITLIGMHASHIFGGQVIMETVFNIPGMGRLAVSAVFAHDYAIVQGCCLITCVIITFANLVVDISYGWLDPRIRYG